MREAEGALAYLYATGQGVPRDDAAAAAWYRKAAEQGDLNAANDLGALYANGRGVARDDGEAAFWYGRAAAAGIAAAQFNLGVMTAAGRGVAPDPAAAARWYRAAADQGYEPPAGIDGRPIGVRRSPRTISACSTLRAGACGRTWPRPISGSRLAPPRQP